MVNFLSSKNLLLSPVTSSILASDAYTNWFNCQIADSLTQHALYPVTNEMLQDFARRKNEDKNSIWLAIIHKETQSHIGNIDISGIDWINRVGTYNILIGNLNFQGKGLGYEASHLIINHVFNRFNLNRLQLGVDARNISAIKLYNKLGFKEEGRFEKSIFSNGKYHDIIRMRLLFDEYIFDKQII